MNADPSTLRRNAEARISRNSRRTSVPILPGAIESPKMPAAGCSRRSIRQAQALRRRGATRATTRKWPHSFRGSSGRVHERRADGRRGARVLPATPTAVTAFMRLYLQRGSSERPIPRGTLSTGSSMWQAFTRAH